MTQADLLKQMGLEPGTLTGEVAVVTGGARGIGRQTALALASLGAQVVVADVDPAGAEVAAEIGRSGGDGRFHLTDVSSPEAIERLAEATREAFGPATILVNAAIICPVGSVLELDVAQWDRVMAVNLRGAFLTCRTFLPGMLERRRGVILNMISTDAMPYLSAYIASKQGLSAFTRSLAAEVGEQGVHVIAFAPGFVDTPGLRAAGERLAPRLGMTAEQFLGLSLHPAYEGMMPAAHAGAAAAYLIARLAPEYHGDEVTGYTVLERAGFLPPPASGAGPGPASQAAAPASGKGASTAAAPAPEQGAHTAPAPSFHQALALARRLEAMIADTVAELERLPFFVRPLARRGFQQKAGTSLQDWTRTAADLAAKLEQAAQGEAAAAAAVAADAPRLRALLDRLATYYREVPDETARFTKDEALLRQVREIAAERVQTIHRLTGALADLAPSP